MHFQRSTPLIDAVKAQNRPRVKEVIAEYKDYENYINLERDENGTTALIEAARAGDTEMISYLLELGAAINACSRYGSTALMMAASRGQIEALKLLLEKGADIYSKNRNDECSFLLVCGTSLIPSDEVALTCMELLVAKGANIHAISTERESAVYRACFHRNAQFVERLIAIGVDLNAKNKHGWTALHYASYFGRLELVKLLAAKGAQLDMNGARHF